MLYLKFYLRLLPLCLLSSCAGSLLGGPLNVLENGGPKTPPTYLPNISDNSGADNLQFVSFKSAYYISACDDYLIASGRARKGQKISDPLTPMTENDMLDPSKMPEVCSKKATAAGDPSKPPIYSPLDYSVCPDGRDETIAVPDACVDPTAKMLTKKKPAAGSPKSPGSPAGIEVATVTTATTTLTITMPNGQTMTQTITTPKPPAPAKKTSSGQQYPGSSLQSIHAREFALQGVNLADRYCRAFFDNRGYGQTAGNVLTDVSSSIVSVAASIAGLITGAAAAPASVGLLNGLSSNATSIYNKDFLFGSDNISTVFETVRQAEAADKASALPEPDSTDWTFGQAQTVIEQHQALCHPINILALIKTQLKSATPTASKTICPTTPSRPATRTQTMGAAPAASKPTATDTACPASQPGA